MKLEDQVCSLALAKKLKELGVRHESYFRWCLWNSPNGAVIWDTQTPELATDLDVKTAFGIWEKGISAFTVAELGEMLPWHATQRNVFVGQLMSWKNPNDHAVVYGSMKDIFHRENADTETDARAKMLIYLLENHLMGDERASETVG